MDENKKQLFASIAEDEAQREEVIAEAVRRYEQFADSATVTESVGGLESGLTTNSTDRARDVLDGADTGDMAMEAIIEIVGRPVIRVLDNSLVENDIPTESLKTELSDAESVINQAVRSVGRIELNGHRSFTWVGTGWVIESDIIVTNRHVASEFAAQTGSTFDFLPGVFGDPIEASVDFLEEHGNHQKDEFRISKILHIEPPGGPDIAFMQVDWNSGSGPKRELPLWDRPIPSDLRIAVIGYPARDTRTDIPQKMDEIFDNIYDVKRFAPGFVKGASARRGLLTHDCTSLGGNSGSSVIELASGKVVALHFAGREQQANFAVLAPVVDDRLKSMKLGTSVKGLGGILSNEVVEETPSVDEMSDRQGYDPDFLASAVPLPQVSDDRRADVAPVNGRDDGELKYTHYSVVMNADRRIAFYSAVNIDGNSLQRIPRGTDKWFFDPRISLDHQVGNELYKSNPLDRGHLARRLDPSWGASREVAKLAIEDTFFYTNAAPQHLALNRRIWLGLEDHILDNAGDFDLKVSVFSGPVFRDDDKVYRDIKVPNEFWKVVAMVKENGDLSATGYMLSQRSIIDGLEFVFGEHQGFQVEVALIEELTGLDFGALRGADPLAAAGDTESLGVVSGRRGKRLRDLREIVL